MTPIDVQVVSWLDGFALRWPLLDKAVVFCANGMIAKGTFMALFVWVPWASDSDRTRRNREIVFATIMAAFGALAIGLLIQKLVPFRVRPMDNPALHFVRPAGQTPIENWPSSFPSDHAILFAAMATGCWFMSRRLGIAAHLFALAFIGLPRIYVGFHYPTDLLGGAALGILGGVIANEGRVRAVLSAMPMRWTQRYPGIMTAALFVISVQISSVFWEIRFIVSEGLKLLGFHVRVLY